MEPDIGIAEKYVEKRISILSVILPDEVTRCT